MFLIQMPHSTYTHLNNNKKKNYQTWEDLSKSALSLHQSYCCTQSINDKRTHNGGSFGVIHFLRGHIFQFYRTGSWTYYLYLTGHMLVIKYK